MKKHILDIEDIQNEIKKLFNGLFLLERRFYAVALDYKDFISPSWGEQEIFEIRDNVIYRLFSAKLHLELIINQRYFIEKCINDMIAKDPKLFFDSRNINYERYIKEISAIFDSFVYHLVSIFDYLSTLVNYIIGDGKKKQSTLKWNNLLNCARNKNNYIGKKSISNVIIRIHKEFVDKLYEYRSILIHEKSDMKYYSISVPILNEEKAKACFFVSEKLTKNFTELKKFSYDNNITTEYTALWLLKKSIILITDLLFELKKEIEKNKKGYFGILCLFDEKTNQMRPASYAYWFDGIPALE